MALNMHEEGVNPPDNGWQQSVGLKYLPVRLFGVPREHLPRDLLEKRNAALHAVVAEVCFCAVCIPVGAAVRSGVLKASVYLNVITLLMGFLGLWASAVLRGPWIMSHYTSIFATSILFIVYCTIVFAATQSESALVLLVLVVFIVPDIIAAVLTMRLFKAYLGFRKNVAGGQFAAVITAATNEDATVAPGIEALPRPAEPRQGPSGDQTRANVSEQLARHHSIPDTPELYRCPITTEIMNDPVNAEDGYTYERASISEWLKNNNKSPMTNLEMGKNLVPNNSLRSAIMEFVESYERQSKGTDTDVPDADC
jgi:hypothetical protein|eukprot:g8658.t1